MARLLRHRLVLEKAILTVGDRRDEGLNREQQVCVREQVDLVGSEEKAEFSALTIGLMMLA